MDSGTTKSRAKNPKETANIFQKILFLFTIPIFRKGLSEGLNESDIYDIMPDYKANTLGSQLEKIWDEEKKKPNPKLLSCFWKMFGSQFFAYGAFGAISRIPLVAAEPILIGKIVSYFKPNQTNISEKDAWLYCLAFILCHVSLAPTVHGYLFGIEQLALKTQLACCNLIYSKCLALSTVLASEVAAGQAVTLITKDIGTFYFSMHFAQQFFIGGILTILMIYIMYREIEAAAFAGIFLLILFIPLQVYISKFTSRYRLKTAAKTDQRVKITQEVLTAMRIIKMYTWEIFFSKKIDKLRKKEIHNLRILFYIKTVVVSMGHVTARFGFYICFITYVSLGYQVTAEKAFVAISCLASLRSFLTVFVPLGIAQMAELKAALYRITNFLLLEEVQKTSTISSRIRTPGEICVKNLSFQNKSINVLDNINLKATKGITIITGPNGSGKSTLLKILLEDISSDDGTVDVCGKISYASQEPWLFPATVRQNIVFGEKFNEDRYRKVLEVCALYKDINTFSNGDSTLVTDRGLNLSKGQKARISLARTIYKKADVYLLDDCLSSVDSYVGNYIFNKCLKNFLKDSTCVLVTHNLNYLMRADSIVFLDNGVVKFSGNYQSFKETNDAYLKFSIDDAIIEGYWEEKKMDDVEDDNVNEYVALLEKAPKNNLNAYQEQKKEGSVSTKVYYTYFTSGGGLLMFILISILFILTQATASWSDYFVSFWVNIDQKLSEFRTNNTTGSTEYMELENAHNNIVVLYSVAISVTIILTFIRSFMFYTFSTKASLNLHELIINQILNSQMIFFDTHLSGSVINRFSRDLAIVDERMPTILFEFFQVILFVAGILVVVSSTNVYLVIPSLIFVVILDFIRRVYMRTGRNLKRLEGISRSPVVGHLNASLEGLTTIRAHKAEDVVKKQFEDHQDFYNSTVHMNLATNRAFGLLTDLIACFYIGAITISFLFLKSRVNSGNVGLAITQAFTLTGLLQWGIRELAALENEMVSTERFLEYQNLHAESKTGRVFTSWPEKGEIIYKNVSLSYNSTSKPVLKDVNFEITSRQKIGVVGRTGAGKTSIVSALLRLYYYEGTILIDGVDIKKLSINYLRSKISVIPQDPILFSGTLRSNLDPYFQHSDKILWDALDEVEMRTSIRSLDFEIHEGSSDFSLGEKQLLCLARAMVHKNNIIILDEATANIDSRTDFIIQKIIKKNFVDCTVITIAHKLQNILDSDKVIVLDSGAIIQFDSPKALLEDQTGMFYSMVKESGLI